MAGSGEGAQQRPAPQLSPSWLTATRPSPLVAGVPAEPLSSPPPAGLAGTVLPLPRRLPGPPPSRTALSSARNERRRAGPWSPG